MKSRGKRIRKSGGHLFYKAGREPALLAAIRRMRCCFCLVDETRQRTPTEVEHLRTRGASGTDRNNTVPTCAKHREMRDEVGPQSMWEMYASRGLDVWHVARRITMAFDAGELFRGAARDQGEPPV